MYMDKIHMERVAILLTENEALLKLLVPALSSSSPWYMDSRTLDKMCLMDRRMAQNIVPNSPPVESRDVMRERTARFIVYVTRIFSVISLQDKGAGEGDKNEESTCTKTSIKQYNDIYPDYMDSSAKAAEIRAILVGVSSKGTSPKLGLGARSTQAS